MRTIFTLALVGFSSSTLWGSTRGELSKAPGDLPPYSAKNNNKEPYPNNNKRSFFKRALSGSNLGGLGGETRLPTPPPMIFPRCSTPCTEEVGKNLDDLERSLAKLAVGSSQAPVVLQKPIADALTLAAALRTQASKRAADKIRSVRNAQQNDAEFFKNNPDLLILCENFVASLAASVNLQKQDSSSMEIENPLVVIALYDREIPLQQEPTYTTAGQIFNDEGSNRPCHVYNADASSFEKLKEHAELSTFSLKAYFYSSNSSYLGTQGIQLFKVAHNPTI